MSQEPLLSITDASHFLGVNEATLRQWTDAGQIKAFITPGGHRRYSRAELKSFVASRQKVLGLKDLIQELMATAPVHREIARTHPAAWYQQLDQQSQQRLASLSRQLFTLMTRYLVETAKREEIMQLAHDTGRNFGETLARLGLPLTDSVESFISHRTHVMDFIARLVSKNVVQNKRIIEALPVVTRIMDEVLVSLVAAHQENYRVLRDESGKAPVR